MRKFIFNTILIVLLPILAHSQTPLPAPIVFAKDSMLNEFIIHWIRKPYKLGGSSERGIDCSQFNKRLAIDVYKIEIQNTCETQWDSTKRIKKDSLQVGDIIFFRSRQSPSGWHCATYIGETMFVHAANRYEGVKISSLQEPKYKKAYKGAGRYNIPASAKW